MTDTKIRNEQINSENAANGYILTANGSGGAIWSSGSSGAQGQSGPPGSALSIFDDNVFRVSGTAISFDTGLLVSVTGTFAFVSSTATGGGSGTVATDSIWDAKGDLAVGTGADTAIRVAAGTNRTVPVYSSSETAGIKAEVPQPKILTVYSSSTDSHTANSTYEYVNSMTVSGSVPFSNANLLCQFTAMVFPVSANWEHFGFRFVLNTGTVSETYYQGKDTNTVNTPKFTFNMHSVFENVSGTSYLVRVQWHDEGSSLDVNITSRRLTVMVCQ